MNKALLLGFWQDVGDFFMGIVNLIPQIVYFLFTAFSSGIDAMQSLIRKLAGLDTYYIVDTKEAFTQKDPLTEFIYGILGVGNSSATYQALNTVFWSLSIFGLIMLVVSTMIAMIKSHYNEDTAGTSPWKYIYTAIKAILTYAVIPVVLILGLQLSSFLLRTLDNITAPTASEEQIKGVYGSNATEIFVGETMTGTDTKTYIYYDFFGYGEPTNNTPFGSMLFKAAAHTSNRARSGNVPIEVYQQVQSNGKQIFADSSNCQEYASLNSTEEKQEYLAYQIDYAFSNNLHLASSISLDELDALTDDYLSYSKTFDVFRIRNGMVESFSKYDVSAIWFFYNLWTFNYIVAFGGGIVIFGLLISIIVGLMSRLIKGAALFLIYPSLLGLAPLDNFKAFKSWSTNMLQQILMAFGSIIGINLLLLLLPYLQNIAFFNIPLLDSIITMILLIVGLIMTKDFMSMVAGFVGGAEASEVGGKYKGEVASTIKKGATMTGKIAGGTASIMATAALKAPKMATKTIKIGAKTVAAPFKAVSAISRKKKANAINKAMSLKDVPASKAGGLFDTIDYYTSKAMSGDTSNFITKAANKAIQKAQKKGMDEAGQNAAARNAVRKQLKNARAKNNIYDNRYEELKAQELSGLKRKDKKKMKLFIKGSEAEDDMLRGKFKLAQRVDKDGKPTGKYALHEKGLKQRTGEAISKGASALWANTGKKIAEGIDGLSLGKTIAKGMRNSVGALGEATGADKMIAGMKDIMKNSFAFQKKKPEDKLEGDKLTADIGKKQKEATEAQTNVLKQVVKKLDELKAVQNAGNKTASETFRIVKQTQNDPTKKT